MDLRAEPCLILWVQQIPVKIPRVLRSLSSLPSRRLNNKHKPRQVGQDLLNSETRRSLNSAPRAGERKSPGSPGDSPRLRAREAAAACYGRLSANRPAELESRRSSRGMSWCAARLRPCRSETLLYPRGEALWGPSVQNFECVFPAVTFQIK